MRSEIKSKLDKLESDIGIKESLILVWHKDYDKQNHFRYTFEMVDRKEVYYDWGIEVTEAELNKRTDNILVFDIHYVPPDYKEEKQK